MRGDVGKHLCSRVCNVFAEWAGAGVHRVRWPLAGRV